MAAKSETVLSSVELTLLFKILDINKINFNDLIFSEHARFTFSTHCSVYVRGDNYTQEREFIILRTEYFRTEREARWLLFQYTHMVRYFLRQKINIVCIYYTIAFLFYILCLSYQLDM